MAVGAPRRNARQKTIPSSTYFHFPSSFEHHVQRGHSPAETTSATRGKADKMQPQPKNKRPNADMLRQMRGWGWGCLRQEHMFMRGRAALERQTLLRARTQPRTRVAAALGRRCACPDARTHTRMKEKIEMQHRCGSKVRDGRRPGR